MSKGTFVVSNPKIMLGKPVISGTRITVELILEKLAAGETASELIAAYPQLNQNAIHAAMAYAARGLKTDVVFPLEGAAR